jgi:chemotaxis protein methyltransferase CheR
MLCRQLSPKFPGWNMRLLATDLSEEILSRAREGKYSQLEVNRGLPAMLLAQHFVRVGLDWQLKPDVRSMVDFRVLNLIGIWPPLPEMDVVFLRNVLIYFDLETKRAILDRVASTMRRGGLLFLGGVETTLNLCGRFREEAFDKSVAYRLIA